MKCGGTRNIIFVSTYCLKNNRHNSLFEDAAGIWGSRAVRWLWNSIVGSTWWADCTPWMYERCSSDQISEHGLEQKVVEVMASEHSDNPWQSAERGWRREPKKAKNNVCTALIKSFLAQTGLQARRNTLLHLEVRLVIPLANRWKNKTCFMIRARSQSDTAALIKRKLKNVN